MILDLSSFRSGPHQGILVQLLKDWPSPAGFYSREAHGAFCARLNNFKLDPETTVIHDSQKALEKNNSVGSREILELKTSMKAAQMSYPERYQQSVDVWVLSAIKNLGKTQIIGCLPEWLSIEGQSQEGHTLKIQILKGDPSGHRFFSVETERLERIWLDFFGRVETTTKQIKKSSALASFDTGKDFKTLSYRMADLIVAFERGLPIQSLGFQVKSNEEVRNGFSEE